MPLELDGRSRGATATTSRRYGQGVTRPRHGAWPGVPLLTMPWDVEGFLASLGGQSEHTRRAYEHDVREFVAWAERGGCPEPAAADHRALRRYLAFLGTRGFARPSIARKAAAVRAYLRYLRRRGVIATDPGRSLTSPRGRLAPAASADLGRGGRDARRRAQRVETLPGEGDDPVAGALARRDLAVLEVLYGAGLRVSECCGLTIAGLRPRSRTRHRAREGEQGASRPARRARPRCRRGMALDAVVPCSRRRSRPPTPCSSTGGAVACRPATRTGSSTGTRCPTAARSTRTPCGTPTPPTCSREAPTCEPCRSCSVTPTSGRRRSTLM